MRKLTCFVATLCAALIASAQDPNFSQFFASPLTLNPALTGKFDGQYRIAGNYRNQWPTIFNAYTTGTVSFDMGILKDRISEVDQFGVGVMGFTDRSGNGALQYNYLALSTAYHKGLDEDGYNQIGAGFQATYVSKTLNPRALEFGDQLRSDGFTGVTQESFTKNQLSLSYFDVNAGVFYNGTSDGANNYYAGVSAYHINRQKETFLAGEYYLAPRVTFQAGGKIPMGYNALHLSANHSRQAGAVNTVIGGAYALNLTESEETGTNLYLGTWYRLGDALIPYIGLEFGGLQIGATYDVNISSLQPASNMRGGAEFSLIYIRQPRDPSAKKLNCPKF